jgi:hypothetical protein
MDKFFKLDIRTIIIILLVLVFGSRELFFRPKPKDPETKIVKVEGKPYEVIKYKTDTVRVPYEVIKYKKGKDIYRDTTIYVYIPQEIDTLSIIKEYYSTNVYRDTLQLDDDRGYVYVVDSITQNKLYSRNWYGTIYESNVNNDTYLLKPPKTHFYVGIDGGLDKTNIFSSVGVGVGLKTKSDKFIRVGVGVMNSGLNQPIKPYIGGSMYWRVKFN